MPVIYKVQVSNPCTTNTQMTLLSCFKILKHTVQQWNNACNPQDTVGEDRRNRN